MIILFLLVEISKKIFNNFEVVSQDTTKLRMVEITQFNNRERLDGTNRHTTPPTAIPSSDR